MPPELERNDIDEALDQPPREQLLAAGDARQLVQFNNTAALQKRIFADGLVPNSPEFDVSVDQTSYVAQRAEHLLTGEVRVYYAPTADVGAVRLVVRGGAAGTPTPFKRGNRITQAFASDPEFYRKFGLKGHEGLDLVPKGGDRDIFCIEDGEVTKDIDIPGDPKTNAYGIYVVVFSRATRRLWYYCHMVENAVGPGQRVHRGQKLGRMGGTGNTRGDHLHLGLKPTNNLGIPIKPANGFKGFVDPVPVMDALDAADTATALRDKLLAKAETSQVISFNTQAALQRSMFAEGLCPNSGEFDVDVNGVPCIAQRAEDLETGAVRVYFAPKADFADVRFVER